MLDFLFGADRKKVFFDIVTAANLLDLITRDQVAVHELRGREDSHPTRSECLEQSAVFELADHVLPNKVTFEPLIGR